jgi:hypothetical protein
LFTWLSILHVELDIVLNSTDGPPNESVTVLTITIAPVRPDADNQTELSDAALHRAEKAINTMETWSSAVDVIKRVMDTVSTIAAVCSISIYSSFSELIRVSQLHPYASLAWGLLSKVPEVRHLA